MDNVVRSNDLGAEFAVGSGHDMAISLMNDAFLVGGCDFVLYLERMGPFS